MGNEIWDMRTAMRLSCWTRDNISGISMWTSTLPSSIQPMLGSQQDRPVTRHPRFYFDDGTVVLEVSEPLLVSMQHWLMCQAQVSDFEERILYKLHRSILSSRSKIFHDVLSLPRDSDNISSIIALEGSDDSHPFNLSAPPSKITPKNFDYLCTYLFCGPRYSQSFLIF